MPSATYVRVVSMGKDGKLKDGIGKNSSGSGLGLGLGLDFIRSSLMRGREAEECAGYRFVDRRSE